MQNENQGTSPGEHNEHAAHDPHAGHDMSGGAHDDAHAVHSHGEHAGHSVAMFRD